MTEQPVGVREVAEYMGKSEYTIREWAKHQRIPASKPEGTKEWVFFISEIRDHLAATKQDAWALPSSRKRRTAA